MSQHKILVVEDERTSARVIKEMIIKNGYQADIAENGLVALEMFKSYPYPIVITDLDMPEMNGEELIQHLRIRNPSPVIFVETGNADPATIISIMKMRLAFSLFLYCSSANSSRNPLKSGPQNPRGKAGRLSKVDCKYRLL